MSSHKSRFQWKRDPETSRNARTPCGYLINNRECGTSNCDFSHDAALVKKWQDKRDETRVCRWKENCFHNQEGNCFFYHPPEHLQARPAAVATDLEFLEALDVDSLLVDEEVCIENECDLASFNKLSDDEIVVPGELTCSYAALCARSMGDGDTIPREPPLW